MKIEIISKDVHVLDWLSRFSDIQCPGNLEFRYLTYFTLENREKKTHLLEVDN